MSEHLITIEGGATKRLPTAGKLCEKDILITATKSGIDTSDATASADEIMSGETAYVNGSKVTGTFTIDSELSAQDDLIAQIQSALEGKAGGAEVKIATGTFQSDGDGKATITCRDKDGNAFNPDVVIITGNNPYGDTPCHGGAAFTETGLTIVNIYFPGPNTGYLFSLIEVTQTSNGFSVFCEKISTSGDMSIESNRSIGYIAIKYAE
jgi:hypothetical protein